MVLEYLLIAVALLLLFAGAEMLVKGSASVAARAGLTPLVIGLTVVAFGTSSPELAVSLKAAFAGQGDVAVGNVVGSNILNIALILGMSALIYPIGVHLQLIKVDVPIMIVVSILLPVMLVFILRLINDAALTGHLKNNRWQNVVGYGSLVLISVAVAVMLGSQALRALGII